MAGHTPTPWRANLHHTQTHGGRTYGFIMGRNIVPIAAVTLGVEGIPQDEGRANAEMIVRAVNTHADLVASASEWLPIVERQLESVLATAPDVKASEAYEAAQGRVERLRTALARALPPQQQVRQLIGLEVDYGD